MKKVLFFLPVLFFLLTRPCFAINPGGDELLSLANLTTETATQGKVTSLLGKPMKIEESKKCITWYYNHGTTNMVIRWSKKSSLLEKFYFTSSEIKKDAFDNSVSTKLKSGATDLLQALKLLGVPKDMTIKEATQEVHYAYQTNVLRLFFRDRVLVDYTLY